MNEVLLKILYYLAGIPVTYLLGKIWMIRINVRTWKNLLPDKNPWTVKDRRFVMFLAITSWAGFCMVMVLFFTDFFMQWSEKGEDKIAKW